MLWSRLQCRVLSLIQDLPSYSLDDFEKSGRDSFTNKLADGSKITAWIKKCHKKTNPYYCVEKITYSPNPKEMAIAKASKYPQKYLFVSEEQYGNEWPYVFEFGLLECKRYRDVVIIANHKVYAVNGKAMGAKMPTGTKTYEDAWSVRKSIYGTGRMPAPSGLIQKGLELCR